MTKPICKLNNRLFVIENNLSVMYVCYPKTLGWAWEPNALNNLNSIDVSVALCVCIAFYIILLCI